MHIILFKIVTLIDKMEMLRAKKLPEKVHQTMKEFIEVLKMTQAARHQERTSVFFPKNQSNRLQEDRGMNK